MIHRLISLIVKELLVVLKDPKSRAILIVIPIIQAFVFSFVATMEVDNLPVAINNLDAGKWGYELVERFSGSTTFTKFFLVEGEKQITDIIDEQKAVAVLAIPEDFSSNIERGKPAQVQLLLDGRKTNSSQKLAGYCQQIIATLQKDLGGNRRGGVKVIERNWFNPNLNYKWFTVPSLIAILSTLVALLVTAISVARERELGTFEQLLVSPLRPLEILAGKSIAALVVALVEATGILLVAIFFFKVPFEGSLLLFYGSMFVFLLSIVGIGLFISSLSMTQQQGILGAFTFMVLSVVLSGFATPVENMPEWLQIIALVNPMRWFMVIVRGIFLKGMSFGDVWENVWPMAIIAVITLSAATILFRKRME
jgi:ABC-2 type transport system permease protein